LHLLVHFVLVQELTQRTLKV